MEAAGGHWRTQIETARLVDRWPTAPRGHDEPRLAGIILDALDFADQAGAAIIYDLLESGIAVPLCCRKRDGGAAGPSQEIGLARPARSEEHTSELQSLMRLSYAVFCLKKKTKRLQ